jgi:hypothetical protein
MSCAADRYLSDTVTGEANFMVLQCFLLVRLSLQLYPGAVVTVI